MNTRINKQEVWTAGVGQTPVWRDGLDSTLTYLLIAVKQAAEVYNCVCVRRLDQTYFKVKFYPSMEYWSIDEQQLSEFGFSEYRSRVDTHQYERMTCKSHEAMEEEVLYPAVLLVIKHFRNGIAGRPSVRH